MYILYSKTEVSEKWAVHTILHKIRGIYAALILCTVIEDRLSFSVYRGLLSQSKDGVDSYVSLMLLPDKNKATKKKTAVKKRDHNPEYNER